MKKNIQLLSVALLSGIITLGGYILIFDNTIQETFNPKTEQPAFVNAAYKSEKPLLISPPSEGFSTAAEKTVNAVVHVKNITEVGKPSIMSFFYGFGGESSAPQIGSGSGVIISPDGYIVTNNHVIEKSQNIEITLNNNRTYEAKVIGSDGATDIALLKIETEDELPYLAFGDSDNTQVGEWVLAVGNPFNLTSTVTAGIVSAKARAINPTKNQSFIQTDAAVNPGNSGGALVNINGDLIGINTAITSQTGSYVGYSFAVPSNIANKVVNDLLEFGRVQKGILGVTTVPKESKYARENGLDQIDGIYISGVEENSGAEDAGIKSGDIIKMVDNVKTSKFSELSGYLTSKRPGDEVSITIERDGEAINIPVKLKKKATATLPIMNWEVKALSERDKKRFGIEKGVIITNVPQYYKDTGLEDRVLLEVDGNEIYDLEDATEKFRNISRYGSTSVLVVDEKGNRDRIIFR